jgi:hypothetical protein
LAGPLNTTIPVAARRFHQRTISGRGGADTPPASPARPHCSWR